MNIAPIAGASVATAAVVADPALAQRPHANKPTQPQRDILAAFLEDYPELARGRLTGDNAARRAVALWRTVTERLNASGGCIKTWKQWRKFWADKKTHLKSLAARRQRHALGTGGRPPAPVAPLDTWNARMLEVMGGGFGLGETEVMVNPFPDAQVEPQTEDEPEHVEEVLVVIEQEDDEVRDIQDQQPQQDYERIEAADTPPPVEHQAQNPAVLLETPGTPPAARRGDVNEPQRRRVPNQPGYAEVRGLIHEFEAARAEDNRLDRELQREQLNLQRQQLDVNRQLVEAVQMQAQALLQLLQEMHQRR